MSPPHGKGGLSGTQLDLEGMFRDVVDLKYTASTLSPRHLQPLEHSMIRRSQTLVTGDTQRVFVSPKDKF